MTTEQTIRAAIDLELTPEIARMITKIQIVGECWEWQGSRSPFGYGRIMCGRKNGVGYAHRLMYEQVHGPIPTGLQIDHLCRNPPCCRPSHLEAVAQSVNMRRIPRVKKPYAGSGRCREGHSMAEHGCYVRGRYVYCRACRRERRAAARAQRERMGRTSR